MYWSSNRMVIVCPPTFVWLKYVFFNSWFSCQFQFAFQSWCVWCVYHTDSWEWTLPVKLLLCSLSNKKHSLLLNWWMVFPKSITELQWGCTPLCRAIWLHLKMNNESIVCYFILNHVKNHKQVQGEGFPWERSVQVNINLELWIMGNILRT